MDALGLKVNRNGDVPVGTQLAWQIESLIANGRLRPGEQLPSVRGLAEVAGVNVNTVRSVYARLEGEGFVVTQHGRGTFVADNVPQVDPRAAAARVLAGSGPSTRSELKEQISALEAHLSAHAAPVSPRRGGKAPRVLSTEELAQVRDELVDRLEALDAMRDDLVDLLASLRLAMGEGADDASARQKAPARERKSLKPAPGTSS